MSTVAMNNWRVHGVGTVLLASLGAICPVASAGPPTISPVAGLLAEDPASLADRTESETSPADAVTLFLALSWADDPMDAWFPRGSADGGRSVPWGELTRALPPGEPALRASAKPDALRDARSLMAFFLARDAGGAHGPSGVFLSPACYRHRDGAFGYAASSTQTLVVAAIVECDARPLENRVARTLAGGAGIDGLRAIDCYLDWIDPSQGGMLKGV